MPLAWRNCGKRVGCEGSPFRCPRPCPGGRTLEFDACLIYCLAGPGVDQCRKNVKIPLVGCGETSILAASTLGRLGTVTVSRNTVPLVWERCRRAGISQKVACLGHPHPRPGPFKGPAEDCRCPSGECSQGPGSRCRGAGAGLHGAGSSSREDQGKAYRS
ncbi:MAG: aspartate/glutamate racemase family protein [Bacillota bacterium]